MDHSEELIKKQLREGNEKVYEQLFKTYYQRLCLFSLKYINDRDESEEIVQNFFTNFWHKRDQFHISGSIQSYFFSSIRNASLNVIKAKKIRVDYQIEQQSILKEQTPSEEINDSELENLIQTAIQLMPEMRQKVFKMSRFEGLKYQEIADKEEISIKTVENHIGKALKQLRKDLSPYLPLILVLIHFLSVYE